MRDLRAVFEQSFLTCLEHKRSGGTCVADKDRSAKQTSDAELSERIREFESRQKEVRRPNRAQLPSGGMAMAGRVTTELVAGVVVGAFIGWALIAGLAQHLPLWWCSFLSQVGPQA